MKWIMKEDNIKSKELDKRVCDCYYENNLGKGATGSMPLPFFVT